MRLRIRVSLRLVDLEVGQLQSLVFQAVVGAVGLVVHPASQAAVDAELVADVRGAFPPEVDIFERLVGKDFAVADAGELDAERAVVGVVHLGDDLYPFVFEVAEGEVVDEDAFARCARVSGVDDLHAAVAAVFIAAGADGDERGAVVALLRLELVDVAELRGGSEAFGDAEFPLQTLPLVPVAVQMVPIAVGLAFHLVALAVAGESAPVIVYGIGAGVVGKPEDVVLQHGVEDDFAMHALVVVVAGDVGMFGIVPTQGAHIFVDGTEVLACQLRGCPHAALEGVVEGGGGGLLQGWAIADGIEGGFAQAFAELGEVEAAGGDGCAVRVEDAYGKRGAGLVEGAAQGGTLSSAAYHPVARAGGIWLT